MIARRSWLLAAFAAVGFARVYAKPISAAPFADNMVLQCEINLEGRVRRAKLG